MIDADALREFVEGRYTITWGHDYDGGIKDACIDILNFIDNAPPIDAVQVVRCKDCKYSRKDELWHMRWCKGLTVNDEHFCADGERKDNE